MLYQINKCLVLSADDDPDDQLVMQDAFGELDLNCDTAYFPNGQELINYVDEEFGDISDLEIPCMIYLDLNMPQLNGKETLKYLRSKIHFYKLPVFILSTSTGENDIRDCYELGANAVFQKPHEFDSYKMLLQSVYNYWMPFLTISSNKNAGSNLCKELVVRV